MSPTVIQKNGYHHGDLKRALMNEALKIIRDEGTDQFTFREMARRIGVTHAAPYRHFESKTALIAALAEDGFQLLLNVLRESASAADDPLGQLRLMGQAYVRFAQDETHYFKVMFGAEIPSKYAGAGLQDASRATLDYVKEIIIKGQKQDIMVTGNPERLALSAWSLVHGVASLLVEGHLKTVLLSRASAERYAKSAILTLFEGLRK